MNFHRDVWRLVSGVLLDATLDPKSASGLILASGDDWTPVIRLADFGLVTPALAVNLEQLRVLEQVPADARHYLESVKQLNLARNQALAAQLDEAIAALNSVGIVPTLIKGAAHLKLSVYEDPASRMTADLDLLVARESLLNAQRALTALGYEPMPDKSMNYARHHHTPPLCRIGEYASIELHEEPLQWRARPCLDGRELVSESIEHVSGLRRYRTPSPTHAVLLTIAHSEVVNRQLKQWVMDLRALQDTNLIASAFGERIDWPAIAQRFRQHGHAEVFRAFMLVMQKLTGCNRFGRMDDTRSRLRYYGCRVALRHGWLRPWIRRAELLTTARIRSRIGPGHNWLAVNRYRAQTLLAMCQRGHAKLTTRLLDHDATERKFFDAQ